MGRPSNRQTRRLIAEALFPQVNSARQTAARAAQQYFAEAASLDNIQAAPIREYAVEALEAGLEPFIPDDNRPLTTKHIERAAAVASKHIEDAGRRQTIALVIDSDDVRGWARIDPRPPSCAFCLTLISRGPVYTSAQAAGRNSDGSMNQWHPGCTCKVVVVANLNSWEGRDQTLAAARIYREATKNGASISAARRALKEGIADLPAAFAA